MSITANINDVSDVTEAMICKFGPFKVVILTNDKINGLKSRFLSMFGFAFYISSKSRINFTFKN